MIGNIKKYELKIGFKIFLLLLFVSIALIILQKYYFGTTIDKMYFGVLIGNLIPNVLSILFAVFLVDFLIEKKELNDLKVVNRLKSESIRLFINRLAFRILIFFDEDTEVNILAQAQKESDVNFDFVMTKFRNYDRKKLIEIFNRKFYSVEDHIKMADDLKNIIDGEAKIIKNILSEVYPTIDVEVSNFFNEHVYIFTGFVNGMAMVFDIPKKQSFLDNYKKEVESNGKKVEDELIEFRKSLSSVMKIASPAPASFVLFWEGLVKMHDKAKNNNLFLKI